LKLSAVIALSRYGYIGCIVSIRSGFQLPTIGRLSWGWTKLLRSMNQP